MARQYYDFLKSSGSAEKENVDQGSSSLNPNDDANTSNNTNSTSNIISTCSGSSSTLWKSSKNVTSEDREATKVFLELRKQYDPQFRDKKTSKNTLWQKINDTMKEMGFYIGDGVIGRERCRQKFCNLQTSYLKAKQRRKRTGEGVIILPPFFEELDELLSGNHKVNPVLIIDTYDANTKESESNSESRKGRILERKFTEAESDTVRSVTGSPSTNRLNIPGCSKEINKSNISPINVERKTELENIQASSSSSNRFNNTVRTVRPNKNYIIDTIKTINEENREARRAELSSILEAFNKESEQRHNEVMALIGAMSHKRKEGKKRNQCEDSDSE